jgi:hypothetical protein
MIHSHEQWDKNTEQGIEWKIEKRRKETNIKSIE